MKKKAKKRKRLEPLARIRRRLMRLWTARVGEDWDHVCAVCGSESTPNAHHLENRNTCRALRYDPMNGILLCPSHHKFGKDSAHKGGIWFADWLRTHHPARYEYVLAHRHDDINLNDRETLARIEASLRPVPACDPASVQIWPYATPESKSEPAVTGLFDELDRLFGSDYADVAQVSTRDWVLCEPDQGGAMVELSRTMPLSLFTVLKLSGAQGRTQAAANLAKGGLRFVNKRTQESVDVTERWLLDEFFPRYDKEFQEADGKRKETAQ